MRRLTLSVAAFLGAATLALAAEPIPPDTATPAGPISPPETAPKAPAYTVEAFAAANPACQTIGDGCRICAASSGRLACSTPAIACIKAPMRCEPTAPPP